MLLIIGAALATTLVMAFVNQWYGDFYSLAQEAAAAAVARNGTRSSAADDARVAGLAHLSALLYRFLYVAVPFALLSPVSSFMQSHYVLTWRLALLESYLERWHASESSDSAIEGASQRIHEDTQRFASSLEGGTMTSLRSALTLIVFAPRLVELGAKLRAPDALSRLYGRGIGGGEAGGEERDAPDAWLLHVCLAVALVGFGVATVVTRHLVGLEVQNQMVEAELRKQLVHAEDAGCGEAAAPAAAGCEVQERAPPGGCGASRSAAGGGGKRRGRAGPSARDPASYAPMLSSLRSNYSRLYANFFGFNLWVGTWSQVVVLLPFVLGGARLFDVDSPADIGLLVQVSHVPSPAPSPVSSPPLSSPLSPSPSPAPSPSHSSPLSPSP